MAILITVFQCDNCASVAGLKTPEDWKNFEANWFEGFYWQFCPSCRVKPETRERRQTDTKMVLELAQQCDEKVLNAEFIH